MHEAGRTIPGNVDIDLFSGDGLLIYSNNDQKSILKKKVTDLAILDKLGKSSDRVEVEIGSNDGGIGDGGQPENKIFIGAKEPGFLDYRGNNWSLILAENTKEAFDSVTLLRNQFIMIAAIILAISIASIFILSRSMSKPISKLRDITNEVSTGSFDTKIEIQKGGGDELAQLSTSFENMRRAVVSKTKEILEANEELRRKDRLKDEFINVAAHELRTPIQPILGLCEVLRDKIKKSNEMVLSPEVEQVLGIIIKDAKRLSSLAQRILDVAMLESSKLDLNLQTFDIVDVLSNFVSDFNNQVVRERKDLNIIFEFNRRGYRGTTTNKSNDYNDNNNNKIFVTADNDRVIQVISNLLSNAIKSTKEGSISVQVGINPQSEEEVIISVKDMGEGIDPAILPRLFEKFSAKSSGGIGLGLYIAKNILDAHRGRIWVENNEEGKGVTFFFTLPRSR